METYPVPPEIEGTPEVTEGNGRHPVNATPSVVDLLKRDLEELSEHKDVYIKVQGYENTGLQIRYKMPESGKELDNIARKVQRDSKTAYDRNINTAIDTMVHLCVGLYVQPIDITDELVELDPENTGSPVGLDIRLAETFGWPDAHNIRARDVVKRLFGKNDMAIINHSEKLNRWLMDNKANLNLEIWQVGE